MSRYYLTILLNKLTSRTVILIKLFFCLQIFVLIIVFGLKSSLQANNIGFSNIPAHRSLFCTKDLGYSILVHNIIIKWRDFRLLYMKRRSQQWWWLSLIILMLSLCLFKKWEYFSDEILFLFWFTLTLLWFSYIHALFFRWLRSIVKFRALLGDRAIILSLDATRIISIVCSV